MAEKYRAKENNKASNETRDEIEKLEEGIEDNSEVTDGAPSNFNSGLGSNNFNLASKTKNENRSKNNLMEIPRGNPSNVQNVDSTSSNDESENTENNDINSADNSVATPSQENSEQGLSEGQDSKNSSNSFLDNFRNDNNFLKGSFFNKFFKYKIIVGIGIVFFFILMFTAIVAGKDFGNLDLTNSSNSMRGGVASADVAAALEEVGKWYIENIGVYDQGLYVPSPFMTEPVRADCTGFTAAYMARVAGADVRTSWSGEMVYPDGEWAQEVAQLGWKAFSSDEIGELQMGDVLVAHSGALYCTEGEHAEVYIDSSHTFGWGSAKTSYPSEKTITKDVSGGHVHFRDSGHDYITIYRYEGATQGGSVSAADLNITKQTDSSFNHGSKAKENQKYIMLHDTEMDASPSTVVTSWANSGNGVAAHFVVGGDGSIVQAVELDTITHHAGWGGPGDFDAKFGVGNNDGKGKGDDLVGTTKSGYESYTSYGMNSYSIGIEMCHVNGQDYPDAQLNAVDKLIAYIDSYYGFKSEIIDHKDWRPSNSDTDSNFSQYLNNYKSLRHH